MILTTDLLHALEAIQHGLAHFLGLDNLSGPFYGWWSGSGSDIQEIAVLGTILTVYKHKKCITCPRIAHHPVAGTTYRTCRKHTNKSDHSRLHLLHKRKHPGAHELINEA